MTAPKRGTRVVSGEPLDLERMAVHDSTFLLGSANGLRDVTFSSEALRQTHVAMDDGALELPVWTSRSAGELSAEISPRGRIRLRQQPPAEQ